MIIPSRRKRESLFRRFLKYWSAQPKSPTHGFVLSRDQFRFELEKEKFRCDRRNREREFALISIELTRTQPSSNEVDQLITDFHQRLRITDVIGWYGANLHVLLPETDRDGALNVANELAKMALVRRLQLDTEVFVYPWDDPVATGGSDLGDESGLQPNDRASSSRDSEILSGEDQPSDGSPGERRSNPGVQGRTVRCQANPFSLAPATPMWKRGMDISGALAGLILLSPVFAAAAIAIKLTSPGPIFFRQKREGKDGRVFDILKFRTMDLGAESRQAGLREQSEQDGPAFKLAGDPRVTGVGRYLRKTCIDELPQLINVLWGEMSLVGPRPLPVNESKQCKVWQRRRLEVLPGLTCIWQTRGGREVKFADWMRMDMEYVRRRSFWFDLRLIMRTIVIALLHRGSV